MAHRSVLLAKHEASPGNAISLSGSDGVFNVRNCRITPDISFETREGQGSPSPMAGVIGGQLGTCEFDVDCFGGASAGWAATFLPPCGFGNSSGAFTLDSRPPEAGSSTTKNLTLGHYIDGIFHRLHGSMGSARFTIIPGVVAVAHFMFRGIYTRFSDVALPAPTYPSTAPLRAAACAFTIGSASPKFSQLVIDMNNQLTPREDVVAGVQGYHSVVIAGPRNITVAFDPEAQLVANYDPMGDFIDAVRRAFSLAIGSSGNRVTFAGPKLQLTKVDTGARGNMYTMPIEGQFTKSVSGGEDEFTITTD